MGARFIWCSSYRQPCKSWAAIHDARATALQRLGGLSGDSEVLGEAVANYDTALSFNNRDASPVDWAKIQ